MADRRLPGGYGQRKGEDSAIGNAESQYLREALLPAEDGWILTTLGEVAYAHTDVTAVAVPQDRLTFYYIPERTTKIAANEARINVALAVPNTYVEIALFNYKSGVFKRIPGTYAEFDTTSYGLQTRLLDRKTQISPESRLFLGVAAHGGTPILEGFQSGAGSKPRVISQRVVTATVMGTEYTLAGTSKITDNADIPMVAYLAQEAALVL